MALNIDIFETDPDAKPEPRKVYSDDTVGRFHSGHMIDNGKGKMVPAALNAWKVSTGDAAVGDAIAQLFGGQADEDPESTSENFISVYTEASKVPVILADADALDVDFKEWKNGKLTHHCTGSKFLSHPLDDKKIGTACGCPALLAEKKLAWEAEMGPKPSIAITFRLADDPELGLFKFQTGSFTMLKVLHEYADDLADISGEAVADLTLELVSYVPSKGKMAGKTVEYIKPVLDRIRSYNAAIAD
jgi:hypothetical protein